jgi:hypothetical protein
LELFGPVKLNPVLEVTRRSSTDIVSTHHGELFGSHVRLFVEANKYALDEEPHKVWYKPQESWSDPIDEGIQKIVTIFDPKEAHNAIEHSVYLGMAQVLFKLHQNEGVHVA